MTPAPTMKRKAVWRAVEAIRALALLRGLLMLRRLRLLAAGDE